MKNNKKPAATYLGSIDLINAFIDIVVLNKNNRPDSQVGKTFQDFKDELNK
jgi:hypothetical protein